ncbi:MAG TPA: hypothetical protein VGD67_27140 [Pseudonocardiaceae bacterium]
MRIGRHGGGYSGYLTAKRAERARCEQAWHRHRHRHGVVATRDRRQRRHWAGGALRLARPGSRWVAMIGRVACVRAPGSG